MSRNFTFSIYWRDLQVLDLYMNPALNFRVPPSRAMAMAGRVAGTVIMAMLAFVILLCGVAFFFGRNLGEICDG